MAKPAWPKPYKAPTSSAFGHAPSQYQHPTPPAPSGHVTPSPAPPPPVGGPPIDPQALAYGLVAGRNLQIGGAEAAYQTGQAEQTYGYGATGAANPYSRAALLEETYKRSKLGTTNQMANAGQLYSGAYGRAQDENARQYSIVADANRRAYDAATHGINYGQAVSTANYGIGMDDATFNAILRQLGLGK